MGWGRTNNKRGDAGDRFTGGAHSNVLQKLKVPFIPNVSCRGNYKAFRNITTNKQICAGGERGTLMSIKMCIMKRILFTYSIVFSACSLKMNNILILL